MRWTRCGFSTTEAVVFRNATRDLDDRRRTVKGLDCGRSGFVRRPTVDKRAETISGTGPCRSTSTKIAGPAGRGLPSELSGVAAEGRGKRRHKISDMDSAFGRWRV